MITCPLVSSPPPTSASPFFFGSRVSLRLRIAFARGDLDVSPAAREQAWRLLSKGAMRYDGRIFVSAPRHLLRGICFAWL